jgi:peptidoglycan/LPS O-acetylase OafA/YrhL
MYSLPMHLPPPQRSEQLQSLTPLRGMAALWVVLYHYIFVYLPTLHTEHYSHILQKGYLAVDMFFLLSGFVMTHVYHRVLIEDVAGQYWNFLSARIARLYPLHLSVLGLLVATALTARMLDYATTGTFQAIPLEGANLFMLQGLKASSLSWNYPAWSISVEFMAYLAFPFFLSASWRAGMVVKLILAIALLSALVWFAVLTRDDFNQWDGPRTLLRCLPEFMLGTLLYSTFRNKVCVSLFARDGVMLGIAAIAALCLHVGAPDLLIVLVFALVILAAVANNGKFAEVLNVAPLVWLGEISYSLYLIHGFVQYAATAALDHFGLHERADLSIGLSLALLALMLAMCLAGAHLSYRGIEIGCRKHLRALLGSDGAAKPKPATARAGLASRPVGA